MNIDQIAMCYISIDLSQRALQTIEKLSQMFDQFSEFWPKTEKYSTEL